MKKCFLTLVIIISLFCSCEKTTDSLEHPYFGWWNFTITGNRYGDGFGQVDTKGNITGELSYPGSYNKKQYLGVSFTGTINNEGEVECTFDTHYNWSGYFKGNFKGENGNGTWSASSLIPPEGIGSGKWTATKGAK